MLKTTGLIKEELIFTNLEAKTSQELFYIIGNQLISLDYVKPTFIQAIIEREKEYPTGLALETFHVAIPHTDPVHITKPFVAVAKNQYKLPFIHMGTDDNVIDIDCFFILGITNPNGQITLLQTLMERFNNPSFVENLKNYDKKELFAFLQTSI
ncbi:PTS sugar transporter subunit IIA [Niallia sp.]|uniref:PTS sugar transporter subunit IIA n=1 Tax=Niallia sp. TaxID=2837523 RepID=UPI00289EC145|nr:PTS sugar transporter subunit IIA [Niallia sp.]